MKLTFGWGIQDVPVTQVKPEMKAYYTDWREMIRRCYCKKWRERFPSCSGNTVCEEWKYFSNFIKWVDSQPNSDWRNQELDKDILVVDNKVYSPDTCVYVPHSVNKFMTNHTRARGQYMLGVTKCKTSKLNPFTAECQDPLRRFNNYIGIFPTELEAHKAWQAKKHEYACQLADLQNDPRVADALRSHYAPDKDWTKR